MRPAIVRKVWDYYTPTMAHLYECLSCGKRHVIVDSHTPFDFCPHCGVQRSKEMVRPRNFPACVWNRGTRTYVPRYTHPETWYIIYTGTNRDGATITIRQDMRRELVCGLPQGEEYRTLRGVKESWDDWTTYFCVSQLCEPFDMSKPIECRLIFSARPYHPVLFRTL